jgi:hypothetical protein
MLGIWLKRREADHPTNMRYMEIISTGTFAPKKKMEKQ